MPNQDSQFIGHSGVNLLKQRLLAEEINVAVPEIDNGTDLLAELRIGHWSTIQVKTTKAISLAGLGQDSNRPVLTWQFPRQMNVDYLALVNLEKDVIYFYPLGIAEELAQQKAGKAYRLYFDIGDYRSKHENICPETHESYLLSNWLKRYKAASKKDII